VPDVFQEVDELGIEVRVLDAGPGVVFDDFNSWQFKVVSIQSWEKRREGREREGFGW
jgi:hypothetical protein